MTTPSHTGLYKVYSCCARCLSPNTRPFSDFSVNFWWGRVTGRWGLYLMHTVAYHLVCVTGYVRVKLLIVDFLCNGHLVKLNNFKSAV